MWSDVILLRLHGHRVVRLLPDAGLRRFLFRSGVRAVHLCTHQDRVERSIGCDRPRSKNSDCAVCPMHIHYDSSSLIAPSLVVARPPPLPRLVAAGGVASNTADCDRCRVGLGGVAGGAGAATARDPNVLVAPWLSCVARVLDSGVLSVTAGLLDPGDVKPNTASAPPAVCDRCPRRGEKYESMVATGLRRVMTSPTEFRRMYRPVGCVSDSTACVSEGRLHKAGSAPPRGSPPPHTRLPARQGRTW